MYLETRFSAKIMAPEGWSPSIQNPESSTGNLIRESYKFHIFITFHFEYLVRYILSICICFNIVQTVLICKMNIISSGTQSTIATIIDTTQLILLVLAKSGRFCHIFFRSCRYHPSYGFSAFFSGFQIMSPLIGYDFKEKPTQSKQ